MFFAGISASMIAGVVAVDSMQDSIGRTPAIRAILGLLSHPGGLRSPESDSA